MNAPIHALPTATQLCLEAAKRLGMTVNVEGYDFQPLFAATSSGRVDVAISSITITPERLGSQSFTQPYYDSDMGIAAKKDGDVKGMADLKGKVVGVLSGSTGEKYANENKEAQGFSEVKGYNSQQDVLLDLSAGRVDGVVSDVPGMEYAFTKMQGLAVVERISHRVAVMYLGRVVEIGPREAIFENPSHPYTKKLLSAVPVADPRLRRTDRSLNVEEIPSAVRKLDYIPQPISYNEISPGHLVAVEG